MFLNTFELLHILQFLLKVLNLGFDWVFKLFKFWPLHLLVCNCSFLLYAEALVVLRFRENVFYAVALSVKLLQSIFIVELIEVIVGQINILAHIELARFYVPGLKVINVRILKNLEIVD